MTESDVRRIEDKVDGVSLVLAELKGSLQPTLEKLTGHDDEVDKRLDDHEARLRAQEKFRFSVPSIAVLSLLVSIGVLAYYLTTGAH